METSSGGRSPVDAPVIPPMRSGRKGETGGPAGKVQEVLLVVDGGWGQAYNTPPRSGMPAEYWRKP